VQREPGDGVPSSVETAVYLSYDEGHLYAVFICKDDPAKVRANMTKREAIMGDDVVGLLLDTYHDGRRAYQYLANPLGIQARRRSDRGPRTTTTATTPCGTRTGGSRRTGTWS